MGVGSVKALLYRARKLERANTPLPLFKFFGSPDEFAEHVQIGIDAGSYDPRDMPVVVKSVRRWTDEWIAV